MTGPRIDYSPDNPFAGGQKRKYSADNPFAQKADFSDVQSGTSTTAAPEPESHPIRDAIVRAAITNPVTAPLYLAGRKIDNEAAAAGAIQGATLGYADELAGGAMAPFGKAGVRDNYSQNVNAIRSYEHGLQQRSPKSSLAGELVGALAPVVLTGGATSAEAAPSLLRATGKAALQGAGYGAVAGYGGAEGSQGQQLAEALGSGVAGGILGAATPSVVRGGTALYRAVTEGADAKATRVASEQLMAALQRDGYTAERARAEVQRIASAGAGNKPAALIDLPNAENVRGAARGVHSQPGPGRQTIQQFTDQRRAGATARVQQDFTATSGTPAGSPSLERERILAERRAADARNYGASVDAMGDTPITDPDLLTLIEDKPSLGAARQAAKAAETERVGKAAMAAREGAEETPAIAETSEPHRPYDSAKRPNGDNRPVADLPKVSDEGLFRELSELMEKRDEGVRRSQYPRVWDDDVSEMKTVATRKGAGPSEQSKAFRNLSDWNNRLDAVETELKRRGHTDESIADLMLAGEEGRAERAAERAGMQAEPTATGPTARELQRMKQELDVQVQALKNPNAPGKVHSDAREIANTRAQLVDAMNRNIPGYQEAAQQSAARIGEAKAVTLGAQAHGKSPDAVGELYRGLRTDTERAAFRRAYGQKELERIGNGGSVAQLYRTTGTVAGADTKLAKLRAAFGDDASFQRYLDALKAEGNISVGNAVTGNSNTASKIADQRDLARHPLVRSALELGKGNVGSAIKSVLASSLEQRSARLSEKARATLADYLVSGDPGDYLRQATTTNGFTLARYLGAVAGLSH